MISGFQGPLPSCSDRVCRGVYLHTVCHFLCFGKAPYPLG